MRTFRTLTMLKKPAAFGGDLPSKLNFMHISNSISPIFSTPISTFSLFETSQSLFWASFGLVDLMAFELQGIKSFTRFWAMLMFGSYSVINIIVLLNMLIAMMSNSYQIISVSKIWNVHEQRIHVGSTYAWLIKRSIAFKNKCDECCGFCLTTGFSYTNTNI